MLLNYVLRQGYQVLKRYVLLFLALIPYILPIIPQIKYKYQFDTAKSNDSFRSFAHYFNIWPDSIYIFPFANDVASTAISFPPPKAKKENSLCIFLCRGTGNAQRLYRRRNNRKPSTSVGGLLHNCHKRTLSTYFPIYIRYTMWSPMPKSHSKQILTI